MIIAACAGAQKCVSVGGDAHFWRGIMNAKDKIVQTVNDGINAINGKIEQQKAAAKKRERRKKAQKVFRTAVNILIVPLALVGIAWMAAELLTDYQPEFVTVRSGWTFVFMAAAALSMITFRLIPVKIGVILLSACILVRNNGWLWGILGEIPLLYIAAAAAVIVALVYAVVTIVRLKNGAKRQWKKTKKTVTKKAKSIRSKVTGK